MTRIFSHVMSPNGSVAIITLGTPRNTEFKSVEEQEQRFLDKTLFELHRKDLVNPLLSGQELEHWQMNVHFDTFQDPPARTAREITGETLPDRARRHAWRERTVGGVPVIIDDRAIPDLPPQAGG